MKTEEMIEVMQAFVDGNAIEVMPCGSDNWQSVSKPLWDWCCFEYRIKTKGIKKLLLPWEFIDKKYNYAALDEGGDVYVYEKEPEKGNCYWYEGGKKEILLGLIIDIDGFEWQESLTERQ